MLSAQNWLTVTLTFINVAGAQALADDVIDHSVVSRLREESFQHSQVDNTISYLSDVYGPRLTGTPRYLEMVKWVESQLCSWGINNIRIESFGEGLRGWEIEAFSAVMTSPAFMSLNAQPVCCSRSTDGPISGAVTLVDFYDLEALQTLTGRLRGKILLHPEVTREFDGETGAWSDDRLKKAADRFNPVTPDGLDGPGSTVTYVERLKRRVAKNDQSDRQLAQFLIDEGVAAVLRSSSAPAGVVNSRIDSGLVEFRRIGEPKPVPLFVIPREQHARLLAIQARSITPELSLNLTTRYYEDPLLFVNLIAEIPGSDRHLRDQVVFLGAHLDSVETGTGAADNGVGAATSMEVLRMIKALNLSPRRTIRVGLWGAEEQGLLGSSAYVKRHFGDILSGEFSPNQEKISAYFNHDNNGHDIRGIYLLGHEAIRPIFQAFLDPFANFGASTVTIENAGGTDILVFDATGIPSFEWIHDPQNYFSHQLHTNLDVPDLVKFESVQRNAVIIGSVVYHTAMRDEKLPRKMDR